MAKVTITISDTKKGLDVELNFDPPAQPKKKPTPAQAYGLALFQKIKSDGA